MGKKDPLKIKHRHLGTAMTNVKIVGTNPLSKITKFEGGDPNKNYPVELRLVSKSECYLSSASLEAIRVVVAHKLESQKKKVKGRTGIGIPQETKDKTKTTTTATVPEQVIETKPLDAYWKIIPYPHRIIRVHGLLGIAKAERLQKGMRHSYGKPNSRVAKINPDQPIIIIRTNEELVPMIRDILRIVNCKIKAGTKIEEKR